MLKLNIIVLPLLMQIIGSSGMNVLTNFTEPILTANSFVINVTLFQKLISDVQYLNDVNEIMRLKLEVNSLSMEKMQSSMEKEVAAVKKAIASQCTEETQQKMADRDLKLNDRYSKIIQLLETKILSTVSSNIKSEIDDLRNSLLSSRKNKIGNLENSMKNYVRNTLSSEIGDFTSSLTNTTKSEIENFRKSMKGEVVEMKISIMTDVNIENANLSKSLLKSRKNEMGDLENSLKSHMRNSSEMGNLKSILQMEINSLSTNVTYEIEELRNSFKSEIAGMKNSIMNVRSEVQNIPLKISSLSISLKDESANLKEFVVNSSKIDNLQNILEPQISELKSEFSKSKDSLSDNVTNEINSIQMEIKSHSANVDSEMNDLRTSLPIRVSSEISHLKETIQPEINRITNISKSLETAVEVKFNKFENTQLQTKESLANLSTYMEFLYLPKSCVEALQNGEDSGIYKLYLPSSGLDPFNVYCLRDSDNGPAWTIFQRRQDGSVDFYKNWQEYKEGFGDLAGEYFLGLEKLYALTNQEKPQQLWIKLGDWDGATRSARYTRFKIGNEMSKYTMMELGDYSGDAGEALNDHLGQKFSTWDSNDEDGGREACAVSFKGAWWFDDCYNSHLNGPYLPECSQCEEGDGIDWNEWRSNKYSLKYAHMALRPSK